MCRSWLALRLLPQGHNALSSICLSFSFFAYSALGFIRPRPVNDSIPLVSPLVVAVGCSHINLMPLYAPVPSQN